MTNNDKLIIDMVKESQLIADEYTYPVFTVDAKGKLDLVATSLTIEVARRVFLITASHVLKGVKVSDSSFSIVVSDQMAAIEGEFIYSGNEHLDDSRKGDHFDIAFVELGKEFLAKYQPKVLSYNKLAFSSHLEEPVALFVHGFPNSRNKKSKILRNTVVLTMKSHGLTGMIQKSCDWERFEGKNDKFHISLMHGNKIDGNKSVHPRGISGGGLWGFSSIKNNKDIKLYGVFIEYFKKQNMSFSTRIELVVDFILSQHSSR